MLCAARHPAPSDAQAAASNPRRALEFCANKLKTKLAPCTRGWTCYCPWSCTAKKADGALRHGVIGLLLPLAQNTWQLHQGAVPCRSSTRSCGAPEVSPAAECGGVRKAQKLVVSWRGKKGKADEEDSALATAFCSHWPNLTIWQLSKRPARDLPAAQNTRCSWAVRSRAARYCLSSPAEPRGAGTSSFSLYGQGQANTR